MARFDGQRYLAVAGLLAAHEQEEYSRSVTNRAYYATFCTVRDIIEVSAGRRFSTRRSVHGEVIAALTRDPRTEVSKLGAELVRLYRERLRADYNTVVRYRAEDARSALALARDMARRIPLLLP